jgi:carbon-monoxide dehydrogenase large subunit
MRFASPSVADFSACEVVVAERIANQRLTAAPIEGRSGAAMWTDDGRLVHYSACQGAHPTKALLAGLYRLDPSQVRVIVPDVGGGFGAKSRTYPEELALGWYARAIGRAVRWTETRSENIVAMPGGRAQLQYARLGGTRDGRITAYQLDVVQDAGAFPLIGASLPGLTERMATGVYHLDNVGFSGVSVVTNTVSTTAYRGAGRPEAAVAIERMVDRFAAEIGIDPAEVRLRNYVPPFSEPYTTGIGTVYDVGDYPASLRRALDAAGYDDLRAAQAARRAADDPIALGIGLATYVEVTAAIQTPELASVELADDGGLVVTSGATPYGQGHDTTWAMIVADATGVPLQRIRVVHGDTDLVESGGLTVGSRSVQLSGTAIAGATTRLVDAARQRAAERLEAHAADVVLDAESGHFHVAGTPARSLGWADLVDGERLSADYTFAPPMPTYPFGTHVAVVEVDTETGRVQLRRHVAVDDAGTLINPLLAEGQIHGGIAQGAAQALLEEVHYDLDDGQPKTTNFADYPVISAAELPMFELAPMQTPTFANELGAKGVGESGTIGSIPSVYNAVIDALAHLGVRHLETPLTPERIWRSLTETQQR